MSPYKATFQRTGDGDLSASFVGVGARVAQAFPSLITGSDEA